MNHLKELVQALESTPDAGPNPQQGIITDQLRHLLQSGLHPTDLPEDLQGLHPAEVFKHVFDAIGGIPRFALFADRDPKTFYKLYARMLSLPPPDPPPEAPTIPDWMLGVAPGSSLPPADAVPKQVADKDPMDTFEDL